MNGLEFLLDSSVWQQQAIRLSLTLLHFVWQGLLVGMVAAIALQCCHRKSVNARYLIACLAFFSMPLLAAATFLLAEPPAEVAALSVRPPVHNEFTFAESMPDADKDASDQPRLPETSKVTNEFLPSGTATTPAVETTVAKVPEPLPSLRVRLKGIYSFLPSIAVAYLIGALLMLLRLQMRIWRGTRLCSRLPPAHDQSLLDLIAKLARQAGLRCVPAVHCCDRVIVPTVVGVLKPVVLVPVSLISQLTPDELAAVLKHELAHIRRLDPIVQVLQKIVEALLFFHPVTWWLSRRIRIERENCCDDIASRDTGQLPYAAALLRMAELCVADDKGRSTALASLAADGNHASEFAARIRRLIGADDTPTFGLSRRGVYLALGICLMASVALAGSIDIGQQPKAPSRIAENNLPDDANEVDIENDPATDDFITTTAPPADETRAVEGVEDADSQNIRWSKKNRNGLLAGAKLLSATGELKLGDPVVVQFVLRNDSDAEQTFVLQGNDSHPTLGSNNRLELNVFGKSQSTFQHTLKPGEVLEKREYRVTVDTTGMSPGKYTITSGTAFWQAKADNPNSATGIPYRNKNLTFTLGDPDSVKQTQPLADENPETKIYWGDPTGNLILGMRLPAGRQTWPDDQTDIEGQLFLYNAGENEIELTCELPNNAADWNMHVTSRDNEEYVRLNSTWFTGIEPQRTRTIRLPSGEQVAVTGVRAEVTTDGKAADEMIKGPTLRILKEETEFKYGHPKRLINQQGRFSFHAALTIRLAGMLDSVMIASSAPVPFEIGSDHGTDFLEPSPTDTAPAASKKNLPSKSGLEPTTPDQSNIELPDPTRVVAATVLGKPIYLDQFDQSATELERLKKSGRSTLSRKAELLLSNVAGKVMMDYYRREDLHPNKEEIAAKFVSALRDHPELAINMMLDKQARFEIGGAMAFGIASSTDWVVTKHLHEKYGGNVSVSSFGAMISIEGRNALIREYVQRGDVQFHLPELEQALWEQAEKKIALDATVRDQERVKQKFETPPWENFAVRLNQMPLKKTLTKDGAMSNRILTVCLFPFPRRSPVGDL